MVSMKIEDMKKLEILDDIAEGFYVDPDAYVDLDMQAIRKYMKENNLKGPLSDEEIEQLKRS